MRTPATLSSSLHQWAVLTRGSSAIGLRKLRHENDLAGLGRPDAIKHFVRRPSFGERKNRSDVRLDLAGLEAGGQLIQIACLDVHEQEACPYVPPLCFRSEERRVGKEGVSSCRSRWSQDP